MAADTEDSAEATQEVVAASPRRHVETSAVAARSPHQPAVSMGAFAGIPVDAPITADAVTMAVGDITAVLDITAPDLDSVSASLRMDTPLQSATPQASMTSSATGTTIPVVQFLTATKS